MEISLRIRFPLSQGYLKQIWFSSEWLGCSGREECYLFKSLEVHPKCSFLLASLVKSRLPPGQVVLLEECLEGSFFDGFLSPIQSILTS